MIRFRRLFELTSDIDRRRFAEASDLFRTAFPQEADAIDRIAHMLLNRRNHRFRPDLPLGHRWARPHHSASPSSTTSPTSTTATCNTSRPTRASRRAASASRCTRRCASCWRPAGRAACSSTYRRSSPTRSRTARALPTNRKRLRFYARYDAQKVVGTLWDVEANPRNDGYLTTLLYDPLGRRPSLNQRDARRVVRRILVDQYAFEHDDPFVAAHRPLVRRHR